MNVHIDSSAGAARVGRVRAAARFGRHYAEMVIAMALGMMLLGPVWRWAWPQIAEQTEAHVLTMALDMTLGMALWMRVRRHGWGGIGEMSLAMILPFVVLLVPYWLGAVSGHMVMLLGHVLMLVAMALVMLRRRDEYIHHHHPVGRRVKTAGVVAGVLIAALLVPAAVAGRSAQAKFGAMYAPRADAATAAVNRPARDGDHDLDKPTVAFLVNTAGANAGDLLGPYEVLANTGRFNTYIVSPERRLVPLTGGLDIVPDLTFAELDRLLGAKRDDLDAIVVPALQATGAAESATVSAWLRERKSAGTLVMSVCAGARVLAEGGILDGRPATTHWWRLPALRDQYPQVKWVRGKRYVDDGDVITTAGVLSGVDGGLRLVERFAGTDAARQAAAGVHWQHYSPGRPSDVPDSALSAADAVVVVNAGFRTGPTTIGVHLTDGVGELELASAFTSYTEQSMIGRTVAVGDPRGITSKNGLTFVPRSTLAAAAGELDRLIVPGLEAARHRSSDALASGGSGAVRPVYLHTEPEFAFDAALRDIAGTYDVATARWTAKTLEYLEYDVELAGSRWPWAATLLSLGLALLGAAAAILLGVIVRRVRGKHRARVTASRPDERHNVVGDAPAPAADTTLSEHVPVG